ncbi:MAG: (deoxy)nucleoside triphosphate pyrophosphohydrolase [Bacteroidales bacterium]
MVEVSCALILDLGRVLITQRSADMPHPGLWEFPGGKWKDGEDATACIIREIREELNLEVRVDRVLEAVEHRYPGHAVRLHPCVCRIVSGRLNLTEHRNARWVGASDLEGVDWLEADVEVARKVPGLLNPA